MWVGIQSVYGPGRRKGKFSLSLLELGYPSFLLSDIKPLTLRLSDSGWIMPLAFLGFQHVDSKL